MKRFSFLLLILVAVFGLSSVSFANNPVEGRQGRAEVRFLEGMIDHHIMALMMAYDCADNASNEEIKTLCQNVIAAQSAEIAQMQTWLRDWYAIDYLSMSNFSTMSAEEHETTVRSMMDGMMAMGGMSEHSGHNMGGSMRNNDMPMMMGMMAGFGVYEGADYDIAWLESMIDHHDDAIHMSERLLENTPQGHAELLALAQQIIADQTAEIEVMENLILELDSE